MNLLYVANIRLPTEKAHGIQVMEMCAAFARAGHRVTLLVPNRKTPITEDPFAYYGVEKNFKIVRAWSWDLAALGRVGFWLQSVTFAKAVWIWSAFNFKDFDVVYGRDEFPLWALTLFLGKPVFWETHTGARNIFVRLLLGSVSGVVGITNGLKSLYISRGYSPEKFLVAPDAVNLEKFSISQTKEECRRTLGLPLDKKIVLYTGHLYEWKGAHVLAESAALLGQGTEVVFVGGTEGDLRAFKISYGDRASIKILGQKPHETMPVYMKSADVVVLPNSAKSEVSAKYTSPMKLFEYMASGTSIVASDLPSIREILSEQSAFFAKADDVLDLARAIKEALKNLEDSRATRARQDVEQYTWDARAIQISNWISQQKIPQSTFVGKIVQSFLSAPGGVRTVVKYIIAGGTAAVVDLGLLFVFTDLIGIWYLLSAVLAFIVAFGVSFTLQKFWTFRDRQTDTIHKQGAAYFGVAVSNLGLNTFLVYLFVEYLSFHYLSAQIAAAALIAVSSFFIYRHLIFRASV